MITSFLRQTNKWPRTHTFGEAVDIKVLSYNKLVGRLIAEEFKDFYRV